MPNSISHWHVDTLTFLWHIDYYDSVLGKTSVFSTLTHEHRWFSGRMLACHAGGPGSIPGRCKDIFWWQWGPQILKFNTRWGFSSPGKHNPSLCTCRPTCSLIGMKTVYLDLLKAYLVLNWSQVLIMAIISESPRIKCTLSIKKLMKYTCSCVHVSNPRA